MISLAKIRGWKFPIQVDKDTGRIMTVEDNENIKQSIKIILLTQMRERKIVPTFGTNIKSFLFDIVDPVFITDLKKSITQSINLWEKHIRDLHVSIQADGGPVSKVNVNIDYITDITPTQERVTHNINVNI